MKSVLLKLDDEIHAKLSEIKKKEGYRSWEEFIISHILEYDESKLEQKKINELKEKLYNDFLEAKILKEKYSNVLEIIRITIVKLLDGDKEKAREYLLKALDELSKYE